MSISKKMQDEMLFFARSNSLREDMDRLASQRRDPFTMKGNVDLDLWVEFLTAYNEFISHEPKRFLPMIDRVMKL